jgi:peptide/nickel transport system substrate-binding protein
LYVVLTALLLASFVLTACGTPATEEAPVEPAAPEATEAPAATEVPAEPKVATGAWSQEPDSIVPYFTQMSYAIWIAQLTLVGLAEWDENGTFVPELAAEIPSAENGGVSADGLTITWKLKPGLKWSDGEPLTSADVKFTWEAVMDPANVPMTKFGYEKIESIETPDDTTVVIKFSELFPPWQVVFTQGPNNSGAILPKHLLEGKTALESDPFIHQPTVASGPFVITEWVPGDHMTLVRNDNFYGSRPVLDQVNIKFVPTPETALAALQTGDIDWYPDFSESDIATLKDLQAQGVLQFRVVPGADFEHYFFNLGTTAGVDGKGAADLDGFCPFKDVRVRKAITLGIDRQAFVDSLLSGETTVPATQWPNSEWENKSLTPDAYDPDAAAALLEEAGYVLGDDGIRHGDCNGEDTKLSFTFDTTDKQIRQDIALAVQSDLSKIGIEFKPNHSPAGTFFAGYTDGGIMPTAKFQMAGYTTGFYPDPMQGVIDSYACDAVPSAAKPSGANNYLLCDPKMDELLAAVNATADPAGRKIAVDELQKYIFDNYYVVMMYARANIHGFSNNFVPGPFGFFSNQNWNSEVWDVK